MNIIQAAKEKCLAGDMLTKEEIVHLLEIPVGSGDDQLLREAARDAAKTIAGNKAYIWSAVGIDYCACPMNCDFCSLGEKWNLVQESKQYDESEIVRQAAGFVSQGARFVVLRTTEFYSKETLMELVKKLRQEVAGEYEVILNIGEFDQKEAERLYAAGVNGIYHSCRLREGKATPFDPQLRVKTMESVYQSPLKLISLVEPVGVEHTYDEIAENFLRIATLEAEISGAMARTPVPGTPLGDLPMIGEEEMAHLIAVLRLSGGKAVKDICVHPPTRPALESGANVVVVEAGAIPRDVRRSEEDWQGFTAKEARMLFEQAGYSHTV